MSRSSKRLAEIDRLLESLRPWLNDDETFDVLINPPAKDGGTCSVWVDTEGGGLTSTRLFLGPMTVFSLCRSIASELGRSFDEDHPILMGELPGDGSRVTAIGFPITRHGPALCLRKPSSRLITLDDYEESGVLDGPEPAHQVRRPAPTHGHRAMLDYAVEAGWNVLFAGAPQAGKTTLAGAVAHSMRKRAPDRRLFYIEDLEETKVEALPENTLRVQPSTELGITDSDLLQVGKRVRPDGIVVAELLRPQAAYNFLASLNAGMNSSWSTIHANNAHDALVACETLIEQVPGISVSPSMIAKAIDLIVYITRLPRGGRRITEVAHVIGAHGRGNYKLDYIEPALISHERLSA